MLLGSYQCISSELQSHPSLPCFVVWSWSLSLFLFGSWHDAGSMARGQDSLCVTPNRSFCAHQAQGSFPAPWSCPTAYGQVQQRQPATFSTSSGSQPHPCQQGLNPALGREPTSTPAPSSGALFQPLGFFRVLFYSFPSWQAGSLQQECWKSSWRALSWGRSNHQRETFPVNNSLH